MKVTVNVKYREAYLPTPRCRKYRYRDASKETTLTIREITEDEAPVAFVVHEYDGDKFFRYYNGKCYKICCGKSGLLLPLDEVGRYIRGNYDYWNYDYKENRKSLAEDARRFLIIDGVLWERSGEPRYVINTFGLGHNHGGTGLFAECFYNSNISKKNYFSALDGEKAVATANAIAARRGDTKDVGRFKPIIEVLMPEAVKVKPGKQHGDGDPFMNSIEELINGSSSSFEAGLLAIAMTAASIGQD